MGLHCPMRLYCNVLYTNWEDLTNNVTIFGNSFQLYEERFSIQKDDDDDTNGIKKILPYCWETCFSKKKLKKIPLHNMESAFNDCGVISFQNSSNRKWPEVPKEYINNDDDELL